MNEGISKISWLSNKYLLNDIKIEKNELIERTIVFKSFSKSDLGKEVMIKTYYDTPDFFFHKNGINININVVKGEATAKLVIRYDSEMQRINYLNYMPDTYELDITAGTPIYKHLLFIAKAIPELIVNGLEVDPLTQLKTIKPVLIVKKKREKYKFSGLNQLKLLMSFDIAEYTSPVKRGKEKMKVLEVICENNPKEFKSLYEETMKKMVVDNPTIVEIQHSDIFIGFDALMM